MPVRSPLVVPPAAASSTVSWHPASNAPAATAPLPHGTLRIVMVSPVGADDRAPRTSSAATPAGSSTAGELARQTEDPTVLGDALERRTLDETAAAALPSAQALTRAVGRRIAAEPHTMVACRTPGDVLLLCADGVSDLLHTGAMRKTLVTSANLGGRDSATAVAARYVA